MNYLMDSWTWIEFFNKSDKSKRIVEILDSKENKILVSSVNVSEVYKWMLRERGLLAAEDVLSFMMKRCFIIFVSTHIAVEAAKLNNLHKIGLGDSIVYATALLNDAILVTGDADFKGKDKIELII